MTEEEKTTNLDNGMKWSIIVVAIVAAGFIGYKFMGQNDGNNQIQVPQQIAAGDGEAQRFEISARGSSYVPSSIEVKANQPVELVIDPSLTGCAKTIVIPEMGISKTTKAGDNIIRFTPTKPGKIPFSCSMGMVRGVINVL